MLESLKESIPASPAGLKSTQSTESSTALYALPIEMGLAEGPISVMSADKAFEVKNAVNTVMQMRNAKE